jgi:hypothetical protein
MAELQLNVQGQAPEGGGRNTHHLTAMEHWF